MQTRPNQTYQAIVAAPGFCLGVQCDGDEITGIDYLEPRPEVAATTPLSNTSDTANRTETRVFSFAPYIKGRMASATAYDLRFDEAMFRSSDNQVSGSNVRTWTGKLEST